MTELIKVTLSEKNEQIVSGRDLHQFLEIDTAFRHWFKRMVEYGFEENKDYTPFNFEHPQNRQSIIDYALTLDCAKEIAMIQRSEKGKIARQYFIECEKKLKGLMMPNFSDPYEAAIAWANEYKEKQLAIERAKDAEKTVAILTHVNKQYTTTELAKELNLKSAIELNNILLENKIQFKQNKTWCLYSQYANLGYVDIKQEVLDNGKVIYHRRWTQIGREFIVKLLSKKTN